MARGARFLQSFGWLTFGRTAGDAFLFALFVVLSGTFGPEGIGRYSFAMALTGVFAAAADFGLHPFSLVEFSRDRRFGRLCGRILLLRLPLLVGTWGLLAAAAVSGLLPADTVPVVLIVGAYQLLMTVVDGTNAAFIARGDAGLAARTELLLKGASAAIAISLAVSGVSLVGVVSVLPAITLVAALLATLLAAVRYGAPDFRGAWAGARAIGRRALPFAESQVLAQLCSRVDVVLLGFLLGVGAAGVYNVGFRVVFLLLFIPHFAAISFTPQAARLHQEDPRAFPRFVRESLGGVLLVAAPAAAGLWLVGPQLLGLAFGPEFDDSASVLRILAGVLGLSFVSRLLGSFLMAARQEHVRNRSYRVAAAVSVAGNAVLIPALGIHGAALAAVAVEIVLCVLFARALRARVGSLSGDGVLARLGIGLLGTACFWVPFAMVDAPLWLVVPASLLVHAAVLLAFPQVRGRELRGLAAWAGRG